MHKTSGKYKTLVDANIRPVNGKVLISFTRGKDSSRQFVTIGETIIRDFGDYIKPIDDTSIQLWDAYDYVDYSNRLISAESTRQNEIVSSVGYAYVDVILDNHDDFFTPDSGSPISEYILPNRPVRIQFGFDKEIVSNFIGVTSGIPEIDSEGKSAKFHCVDFLSTLLSSPLDETVLFEDKRTDEVLTSLFTALGIEESQLNFDEGEITIPFCYFERGDTIKDAVLKLVQVEQGRFFMDSYGTLNFKNRESYIQDSVKTFDNYKNIIDSSTRRDSDIYNVVIIKGTTRELQDNAEYWTMDLATEIRAGETLDMWANFDDPVQSVDEPVYIDDATTSSFAVYDAPTGGSPVSGDVEVDSVSAFSKSYKMTFKNNGTSTLYITNVTLWAVVASVVNNIYTRTQDTDSVDKFGEQILTIENDFFQSEALCEYQSNIILNSYGEYSATNEIVVRGDPSLQLDDTVTVEGVDYKISKIVTKLENPPSLKQNITIRNYTPVIFFKIGVSLTGGTDKIKPVF